MFWGQSSVEQHEQLQDLHNNHSCLFCALKTCCRSRRAAPALPPQPKPPELPERTHCPGHLPRDMLLRRWCLFAGGKCINAGDMRTRTCFMTRVIPHMSHRLSHRHRHRRLQGGQARVCLCWRSHRLHPGRTGQDSLCSTAEGCCHVDGDVRCMFFAVAWRSTPPGVPGARRMMWSMKSMNGRTWHIARCADTADPPWPPLPTDALAPAVAPRASPPAMPK